jgi:hypothetical protein
VLRAEDRREVRARVRRETIGDVPQLAVDRRRVADDADAPPVEGAGFE